MSTVDRRLRLAIVVSHPIQHFAPLYRALSQQPSIELKVFFCSRVSLDASRKNDFGVPVSWDTDLLSGYQHEFLAGAEQIDRVSFWTINNPDIGEKLSQFNPDVVQVYGYGQRTQLTAQRWCHRHGVPTILMSDSELLHYRSPLKRLAKRLLLPLVYRRTSAFLTIGDNNESYLRHYGVPNEKMFRSPYPTDDEAFLAVRNNKNSIRPEIRQRLNIPADAFVAVFVGKLIPRKRPADLLDAVERVVRRSGLKVMALFVGDGELRATVEQQAQQSGLDICRFSGFINQREFPSMYAAADIVVHPSDVDPHPLAVNEGVIVGLPVVVSDRLGSVGPTDTARTNHNALVYPVGDIEALSNCIEKLARDPQLVRDMGRASEQVAAETSFDASVRGFMRAVHSVTHKR